MKLSTGYGSFPTFIHNLPSNSFLSHLNTYVKPTENGVKFNEFVRESLKCGNFYPQFIHNSYFCLFNLNKLVELKKPP